MHNLPESLRPLAAYKQFILWTIATRDGKQVKLPVDYRTAKVADAHDPKIWVDADAAVTAAAAYGVGYGVGFVFTEKDPFFFVDLDKCLNADNATWSSVAMDILHRFPGAAVEVSQSGRGLHIFGQYVGDEPDHACKNVPLGLELYTSGRFVALTGTSAMGSADLDFTGHLSGLISSYFPPKSTTKDQDWTSEPVAFWTGATDDDELIARALKAESAGSVFSDKASFRNLWECDEDALAAAYPDPEGNRTYDGSSADAALAQHLAFWTGNDCERILKIMGLSGLVRDKWEREDYLVRTITRAVSMQETVYSVAAIDDSIAQEFGAVDMKGSDKQREYATNIRAEKLVACQGDLETIEMFCKEANAKFWLDNKNDSVDELKAKLKPLEAIPAHVVSAPEVQVGAMFIGANLQMELFDKCVYIQELHRVFTPSGALLKAEQFNATYGGYNFQLDFDGAKSTRKAWEAFTESQLVRYPKAEAMAFRPLCEPGALIEEDGRVLVNAYIPVATKRTKGDASPFTNHLEKVLPVKKDRDILLAYMAACIQHKGVKFQWAPLIQGVEGNGKTLFTRCVAFAIGDKYTHMPPSNEIAEKFNEWLFNKIFIGVEDIYVPDHKKEIIEVLKPMITNDRLAKRAMQQSQVMGDNYANFILNSNHKDAIRKTRNDRRFAVFFSAQQEDTDLKRDGMDGNYFPKIYTWLKADGYAIVADYLASYEIPEELNPATLCHRAPETSSTHEAVSESMGGIEQEIQEAIEEGRIGFANGWVSSVAVERLLQGMHATRAIPRNKRREVLKTLGYEWHPALHQGRTNNPVPIDDNKKPRLFIRRGHISAGLTTAADVARVYQEAQRVGAESVGSAAEIFKINS